MPGERDSTHLLSGRSHVRRDGGDDAAIAALSGEQHGVVARRQLIELGVGPRSIDRRLARGLLHRLFAGTYAVGNPRVGPQGITCAGVLAAMPRTTVAVASNHSSVALMGLTDAFPDQVHVTAPERRHRQPGLVCHRATLPADEIRIVTGIPTTCVARTLLDLSAFLDPRSLRRLLKRAEFRSLVAESDLVWILERYPRRKGRRALAALVSGGTADSGRTRSDLEDEFLAFCRRQRLPAPETNQVLHVRGERLEVDCVWPDPRLVIELDGWQSHGGRVAFEDDRARDRALAAAGWTVVRATWRQLHDEPDQLAGELRSLIGTWADAGDSGDLYRGRSPVRRACWR